MKKRGSTKIIFLEEVLTLLVLGAVVFATSVISSPPACSGEWNNCPYAFSDDMRRASAQAKSNVNKTGTWNNYNFSVPSDAFVNSVVVRADFASSNTNGRIGVQISGNGGAAYGPLHVFGGNTAERTFLIDVTNDVAWTPQKLNNGNVRVKVVCFRRGGGTNPTCYLDWLPVRVDYNVPTCMPNWQCTSWSTCNAVYNSTCSNYASGTQTRTCTDLNNCGTTSGKPAEIQSCSISRNTNGTQCTTSTGQSGVCSGGNCFANQTCPTCPLPSSWSTCTNSTQTRINYQCGAATNYACQAYAESHACTIGNASASS